MVGQAKFSWTSIVRHTMVKGAASPDDPALIEYWAERRRRIKPPLDNYMLRLLAMQDGRCPLCGDELLSAEQPPESPEEWERWWLQFVRRAIVADYLVHHGRPGSPDGDHTRLVHAPRSTWRQLRRRYCNGGRWPHGQDRVLFDPAKVKTTRYRYRYRYDHPVTLASHQ